jgi:polysaccharide deacetylase family protein (PEP-CTERM system associated)
VTNSPAISNAFCVDLEEWFHICGVETELSDPTSWGGAPEYVVKNTERLMRLLDESKSRGTFLTVGWVAERYPELIRRLIDAGHEIGCHSYWHRLIYSLTPEEFESDIVRCLEVLNGLSPEPVKVFRAPGFSMKRESFWAYPILRKHGIDIDVSIVPARRDHGGVAGFTRDPFLLRTEEGEVRCFPVSVMKIGGFTVPFSGGGYLRLFPLSVVKAGYRQNLREARPAMSYIHPREIDPTQPRLKLSGLKYFKYYVNLAGTEEKLRRILRAFPFTTVTEALSTVAKWPVYRLDGREILPEDTP